jgi:hypothetical protein
LVAAWSRCLRWRCNLRNGQNAKEQKAVAGKTVAHRLGDAAELLPHLVVLGLKISQREIHNGIFH